ncbi:alpha/beta fold hydrolase [Sphingomonas guangdongensis]|uniref:alpha/beta fold hydrolase n=1 Tax=Sphingomonas guangdongensis TaxID=1141890 RepID=UPI0015C932A6|nr:alpha/beta hydrolase [Sphingomonas guangdongensis]
MAKFRALSGRGVSAALSTWLGFALSIGLPATSASSARMADPAARSFVSSHYGRAQILVPVAKGRRINMVCLGKGQPAVLFMSGLGGGSFDWRRVQPEVGRNTRACAYDRAGYGFSDPTSEKSDVEHALLDLHALLHSGGIARPVVLVAHSLAGIYAVAYAKRYPGDVAGMVLVDPAFPNQTRLIADAVGSAAATKLAASTAETMSFLDRCVTLADSGRLSLPTEASSDCLDNPADPDPAVHRERDRAAKIAGYQRAIRSEYQDANVLGANGRTIDDVQSDAIPGDLGSLPLAVLTRGNKGALSGLSPAEIERSETVWQAGHDRLAALSRLGTNEIVPGADHFIQLDRPATVIERIRGVLEKARR